MKSSIISSIATIALVSCLFSIISINNIEPITNPKYTWNITDFKVPEIDETAVEATEPVKEELIEEEPVIEETYEDEYYEDTSYISSNYYDGDFRSAGVVYGEDGTRYTWYSQNALPGNGLTELNNNGRHVDDRGFVCDGDGYIAVASNDHPQGTIVNTPFGEGRVYDSGCASGTIDIYTDF